MPRKIKTHLVISHVLLLALLGIIFLMPNTRTNVAPVTGEIIAICCIEFLYLLALVLGRRKDPMPEGSSDIILIVWVIFIAWELVGPKLGIAHNVLIPSPENVFNVFVEYSGELVMNVVSSLELLLSGYILGTVLGVILGIICGWIPRLRAIFYPIANVFAPIPSVVFTPFLVIIMPTYRWAAIMVILIGGVEELHEIRATFLVHVTLEEGLGIARPWDVQRELVDEASAAHEHDAVGQKQRLLDVMGDEDGRLARRVRHPQPLHKALQLTASLDVEGAKRLVEQQDFGIHGKRAGNGHALLHATGKLVGVEVGRLGHVDFGKVLVGDFGYARLREVAPELDCSLVNAELDVLLRLHPRKDRVVLENDGAIHARAVEWLVADEDLAAQGLLQSGEDAQRG